MPFVLSTKGPIKTTLSVVLMIILLLCVFYFLYSVNKIWKNETTPITGGSSAGRESDTSTLSVPVATSQQVASLNIRQQARIPQRAWATPWQTEHRRQAQHATAAPLPTKTPNQNRLSPAFQTFTSNIKDGNASILRGVYVEGVISLPVLQQPENDIAFVSSENGTATQFRSAAAGGVTGLLAHNFLSGGQFYDLKVGQEVRLVYGDGRFQSYRIEGIYQYQKLSPNNLQSDLVDLSSGKTVTTNEVFNRFYRGGNHVTFQTCLERDGVSNWGLTFWLAMPLETQH